MKPGMKFPLNADELRTLYLDQKLSTVQIGELCGRDPSNVYRALKNHGIPLRSQSESVKLQWVDKPERRAAASEWMTAVRHSDSYLSQTEALARNYRENPTEGERQVADILTSLGEEFESQVTFGPFIADFVLPRRMIIIEVDSKHHTIPKIAARDHQKSRILADQGWYVARIRPDLLPDKAAVHERVRLLIKEIATQQARRG